MPEATSTPSAAPAASSAPAGDASSSQAQSAPQTQAPNPIAAAQAAIDGKGSQGVSEALKPVDNASAQQPPQETTAQPAENAEVVDRGETLGLSEKQVNALRRAHAWDPESLRTMPTTNLKAYADKLAAKQAQQDREYSQRNQGRGKKPGEARPADAEAAPGQTDDSAGTPDTQQDGQPSTPQLDAFNEQALSQFVLKQLEPTAEETATLVVQFGEDGVKAIRQRETRQASAMARAMMQTMQPMLEQSRFLAGYLVNLETDAGLATLAQKPGFDKIKVDAASRNALVQEAMKEARLRNDPDVRLRDLIPEVAPRVFRDFDPHLAAQVNMARAGNQNLHASAVRPSSSAPVARPVDPYERQLQAAQRAIEGAGVAGVREALV